MQFISSLSAIADSFDAVLLDLWGCVHDGTHLYPDALDAIAQLHGHGKAIIFLSNAPRRAVKAQVTLDAFGLERRLYSAVLTSGEAGFHALEQGLISVGPNYFFVGPERDADVLDGLDYRPVRTPSEADFLLNVGFGTEAQTSDEWDEPLSEAARRGLPMLCLNPDMEVVKITGERYPCAGVLAKAYEALGGQVTYYGKPYPEVYRVALKLLGNIDPARVIGVGDGLHTDVQGANGMGIPSVLVAGGILRQVLGEVSQPEMRQYLVAQDAQPVYVIPALRW